jgi:glycolate oxidase FAD binding subunit
MPSVMPSSGDELCRLLQECNAQSKSLNVIGGNSKRRLGGPCTPADLTVSTARLKRLLQYEPNDLTVSVEAGMPWAELQSTLTRHGQMVALDPPFEAQATVGGVVACNSSGPMRRGYGTARDLIIGMRFATLDGKMVPTGGMVVKNVAGLDMAKLMIGSFGTLAAITSVNFRLHPLPETTETFLHACSGLEDAIGARDELLKSPLRPFAIDLLTPPASARIGHRGYVLAARAGGSRRVLDRYRRELSKWQNLTGADDAKFWGQVRELPADFLSRQQGGAILRVSTPLNQIGDLLRLVSDGSVSRAASGVTYVFIPSPQVLQATWSAVAKHRWSAAIEGASDEIRANRDLSLVHSGHLDETFALMQRIKHMFDPNGLLNRGRLYGRI